MPGGTPDIAKQEASEAPASEPAAAPEPAHASSAGVGAAKERDKPATADANAATPLSLTDAIPAEKLRMTAASALSAAAVRPSTPAAQLSWLMCFYCASNAQTHHILFRIDGRL